MTSMLPATPDLETHAGWDEHPGLGRAVGIGAAVGMALSVVGVTLAMVACGVDRLAAIGLGAFIAVWGGLGFGVMVAGVIWVTKAYDH
jgi:hypothetical protein